MNENKFTHKKIKEMKSEALRRRLPYKEIERLNAIKRMIDLRTKHEQQAK